MKINSLPILYWKNLCNIQKFNLMTKTHRLLTVLFWINIIISIVCLTSSSITYYKEKTDFQKNKQIINDFEANFAINRCFEKLSNDTKNINNILTSDDGLINTNFKNEAIPQGYTKKDINRIFDKILSQIILQETNMTYSVSEIKLLKKLADKLNYHIIIPTEDILNSAQIILKFSDKFYTNEFFDKPIEEFTTHLINVSDDVLFLRKASLKHKNAKLNFNTKCCARDIHSRNGRVYYYFEIKNWKNLSNENALNISKALPYEFSIESYCNKYSAANMEINNNGISYIHEDFLIDPFSKLTFYNPEGFNPFDFKNNLNNAKITMGNTFDILKKYIESIIFIIGINVLFVLLIRLINWVINGSSKEDKNFTN